MDWAPTSPIRQVVIPEHSRPFGGIHPEVALVAVPSGVQKIHVVLYETLKHTSRLRGAARTGGQ